MRYIYLLMTMAASSPEVTQATQAAENVETKEHSLPGIVVAGIVITVALIAVFLFLICKNKHPEFRNTFNEWFAKAKNTLCSFGRKEKVSLGTDEPPVAPGTAPEPTDIIITKHGTIGEDGVNPSPYYFPPENIEDPLTDLEPPTPDEPASVCREPILHIEFSGDPLKGGGTRRMDVGLEELPLWVGRDNYPGKLFEHRMDLPNTDTSISGKQFVIYENRANRTIVLADLCSRNGTTIADVRLKSVDDGNRDRLLGGLLRKNSVTEVVDYLNRTDNFIKHAITRGTTTIKVGSGFSKFSIKTTEHFDAYLNGKPGIRVKIETVTPKNGGFVCDTVFCDDAFLAVNGSVGTKAGNDIVLEPDNAEKPAVAPRHVILMKNSDNKLILYAAHSCYIFAQPDQSTKTDHFPVSEGAVFYIGYYRFTILSVINSND